MTPPPPRSTRTDTLFPYPTRFRAVNALAPKELTALDWLRSDRQGATVLSTANLLLSAERAIRDILPPALAQACRVARIDRQQITLAVPSAAHAAKLRQLAPRITRTLVASGRNLNEAIGRASCRERVCQYV